MVEFLRAKTSTFTNKPMGVIDTRTGGAEVGKAIANLGNNITEMAFKDAVKDQEKLGKDTVLQMPVRDENNDLVIAELPTNLSSVARETAEPLLQRKMADAIYMDTQLGLANIRKSAKNEAEYSEKANVYLEQVEMRLSETGGDAYIQEARNAFGKVSSQHSIDLMIKDGKRENEIALTNHYGVVDQSIASIKLQFATNDPSAQTDFEATKAKILSTNDSFMDVNPTGVSKALDQLEVAKAEGIIRRVTNNASSDDYMKIQKAVLDGGMSLKNVPKEYRESVKEAIKTLDKDLLDDLDAALEPFRIDQTNSENKAKSLFNANKANRQLNASRKASEFANNLTIDIANGSLNDLPKYIIKLNQALKSNDANIDNILKPAVENNRLLLLDGFVRGVTNNMAQSIDDITSLDITNVMQAIVTNNPNNKNLRPELIPYVKTILEGTPVNLNTNIASGFSRLRDTLNQQEIKTNKIKEAEIFDKRVDDNLEPNDAKTRKHIDQKILQGKPANYYSMKQSLNDSQIDDYIRKGYMPESIITQMQKLASGSLSGDAFDTALQRYMSISSKLNKNTSKFQDYFTTSNSLGANVNAKLKAAVDIAEIKGFENFNTILSDIGNMKTEQGEEGVRLKAKQAFGEKVSIESFLRSEVTDANVIREMKPYVEYLLHGGVGVEKIKEKVKNFIDTKFFDTKGIVADPYGPANKSLYSIDAILPENGDKFLDLIRAELPDGFVLGVSQGRDAFGMLKFSSSDLERVYLVPQPISPTNISGGRTGEVLYHVMFVDKSDMLVPLVTKGMSLVFSTKEVTQKIIDKEDESARVDQVSRENDDMDSEALAQSALDADIIKDNNAPSLGKRLMDVD
jgi:hypothetical protein